MKTAIVATMLALWGIGTIASIVTIGKPRKPLDGGTVAVQLVITGLMVAGLLYVASH